MAGRCRSPCGLCCGTVTDGLTNREIAAQLYLSTRTIDYHLHKVHVQAAVQVARGLGVDQPVAPAVRLQQGRAEPASGPAADPCTAGYPGSVQPRWRTRPPRSPPPRSRSSSPRCGIRRCGRRSTPPRSWTGHLGGARPRSRGPARRTQQPESHRDRPRPPDHDEPVIVPLSAQVQRQSPRRRDKRVPPGRVNYSMNPPVKVAYRILKRYRFRGHHYPCH